MEQWLLVTFGIGVIVMCITFIGTYAYVETLDITCTVQESALKQQSSLKYPPRK